MVSGAKSNTKIKEIQAEVDATKKIMEENIDKLLKRGERLEALKAKTEVLKIESQAFNRNALKLKQLESFKSFSWGVMLIGTAIGAGIGVYGVIASGAHLSIIPLCAGLGAALSYVITWPLKGIFELYQKMSFMNTLVVNNAEVPEKTLSKLMQTADPVLSFRASTMKESAQNEIEDNNVGQRKVATHSFRP